MELDGMNNRIMADGTVAHRYCMLGGGSEVCYSAWRKQDHATGTPDAQTFTYFDGACYYRVGTERIPAEIDAIPYGPERGAAIDAWYTARHAEAYALLTEAWPEAAAGKQVYGQISLWDAAVYAAAYGAD